MTGTNYAIAIVMAVCCFMAVMGVALPWTDFGLGSVSGLSGDLDGIGTVSLLPALVVTALFVLTLITKRWYLLVKVGFILFSVIVLVVPMWVLVGVVGNGLGVGVGLWMTLWGGIGMVAASIWGSARWNRAIDASRRS